MASSSTLSISLGLLAIEENSFTFSCGRKWHMLLILTLFALTTSCSFLRVTVLPLTKNWQSLFVSMMRLMTREPPSGCLNVISTDPTCAPFRMKCDAVAPRSSVESLPSKTRQIASRMVLFPHPFCPSTRFRASPGSISTSSYARKSFMWSLMMEDLAEGGFGSGMGCRLSSGVSFFLAALDGPPSTSKLIVRFGTAAPA
mmetsp:Transcript_4364/g.10944  ORF Transcript_4364/g.10944 Transcript_4364/m.10944 type:complete len:200 (-) Transcript_4364:86-685(-)